MKRWRNRAKLSAAATGVSSARQTEVSQSRRKTTEKGKTHLTKSSGAGETQEHFPAEAEVAPVVGVKGDRKYLRLVLWAFLSAAFLGGGCVASGLLFREESPILAALLFVAALVGAAGCMFYFYQFLREISPRPRPPFISTLH